MKLNSKFTMDYLVRSTDEFNALLDGKVILDETQIVAHNDYDVSPITRYLSPNVTLDGSGDSTIIEFGFNARSVHIAMSRACDITISSYGKADATLYDVVVLHLEGEGFEGITIVNNNVQSVVGQVYAQGDDNIPSSSSSSSS